MEISFSPEVGSYHKSSNDWFKKFKEIIEDESIGFFKTTEDKSLLNSCKELFEKFKTRKHFFHIGIG